MPDPGRRRVGGARGAGARGACAHGAGAGPSRPAYRHPCRTRRVLGGLAVEITGAPPQVRARRRSLAADRSFRPTGRRGSAVDVMVGGARGLRRPPTPLPRRRTRPFAVKPLPACACVPVPNIPPGIYRPGSAPAPGSGPDTPAQARAPARLSPYRPPTNSPNNSSSASPIRSASPPCTGELCSTSERGAVSQWNRSDVGRRAIGPAAGSPLQMPS